MTKAPTLIWRAIDIDSLLLIGDPHVSSRNIGRRNDVYVDSVCNKLEYAVNYSNTHNCQALILGDLFHRARESNLETLLRLARLFQKAKRKFATLEGNHDKAGNVLQDVDALSLMHEAGFLDVMTESGYWGSYSFTDGSVAHVYCVPHGSDIPSKVVLPEGAPVGKVLMLTHHDLAFSAPYPNSIPLMPIEGVDLVVNGHIHDTKPAELHGFTWWHNPGNIEPLSIKHRGHVPRIWTWSPNTPEGELNGHELPYNPDVFDLTGVQVDAAEDTEDSVLEVLTASAFVQALIATEQQEAAKTSDGEVIAEDLEQVFLATHVSDATMLLMRSLVQGLANSE